MLDIMFDLPEQPRGSRYVINDDIVHGKKPLFGTTANEECLIGDQTATRTPGSAGGFLCCAGANTNYVRRRDLRLFHALNRRQKRQSMTTGIPQLLCHALPRQTVAVCKAEPLGVELSR